ncbi:hypothetical protein D9M71_847500 [compost metagenome]
MCFVWRRMSVPKNTTPYATQTMPIHTAPVNSISAYSLVVVYPSGRVTSNVTTTACQPQKVKAARVLENSRAWQVRCTA